MREREDHTRSRRELSSVRGVTDGSGVKVALLYTNASMLQGVGSGDKDKDKVCAGVCVVDLTSLPSRFDLHYSLSLSHSGCGFGAGLN